MDERLVRGTGESSAKNNEEYYADAMTQFFGESMSISIANKSLHAIFIEKI